MTFIIKAKKVKPGHSIPGLDNAYVIAVGRGGYDGDEVDITFNDAEGGEGTLTLHKNVPITVDREDPQWVGYP